MRLSNRSFPHPVVGNADDVPDSAFQANCEFESDPTNFYLTANVTCSSQTLLKAIKKGDACYALHVECSNTLFRRIYDFDGETHRVTIPATSIHNTVEVHVFVRAKKSFPKYMVDGSHPDYQGSTFVVGSGDILAISDGFTFEAEHPVDPLRRVGALVEVHKSTTTGDHPMDVEFNQDKIRIILCEADHAAYADMKGVPFLTNHLTTTLVLPVLIEAIHHLDPDPEAERTLKWEKLLVQRIEGLNLGPVASALEKAQRVLSLPIRRALASAQSFLTVATT